MSLVNQRVSFGSKYKQERSLSPTELLEKVKTSLRTKIAALAEDNWMYEAEEAGTR